MSIAPAGRPGSVADAIAALCREAAADPGLAALAESAEAERVRLEAQLQRQALHDPLTGLPNRTLFLDRLTHALARGARSHAPAAVLVVDLDRFKLINDAAGHERGDDLLRQVAARLTSSASRSRRSRSTARSSSRSRSRRATATSSPRSSRWRRHGPRGHRRGRRGGRAGSLATPPGHRPRAGLRLRAAGAEGTYRLVGTILPAGAPRIAVDRTITFGRAQTKQLREQTGRRDAVLVAGTPGWVYGVLSFAAAMLTTLAATRLAARRR